MVYYEDGKYFRYCIVREWGYQTFGVQKHVHCMFCGLHFCGCRDTMNYESATKHFDDYHPFEMDVYDRVSRDD